MSDDYDSRDETGSEDEEDDERIEDSHKRSLTDAREWIIDSVGKLKRAPAEGTKKVRLSDEDVDQFFEAFPDLTHDGNENTPTLLHVIVDLVSPTVGATIDSAKLRPLVQRLVKKSPRILCICNDIEPENALYSAITNKRKILADYMVSSCLKDDSNKRHLAIALENCGNSDKNCLHLAFEKDLKPDTLIDMVKNASITTLEAVDATGRRPMHYAVQYARCNVGVIRAFIERDYEIVTPLIQASEHRSLMTFLDADENSKTSVYQEHVLSASAHAEERTLKKGISSMKKGEASTMEDGGKYARGQMDEAARGRNPVTKSKPELEPESRFDNKLPTRPDQASHGGSRDHKNPQDRTGRQRERDREKRTGDDGALNELEKERERLRRQEAEARREELGRPSAARDASKDRHSLGQAGGGDSLRIQTALSSTTVANSGGDIAANTPKLLRRVPTMLDATANEKAEKKVKPTATITKKSRKPVDHEAAARDSKTVLRMLKLHYMRTRSIEKATSWLYKTNPQGKHGLLNAQKVFQ